MTRLLSYLDEVFTFDSPQFVNKDRLGSLIEESVSGNLAVAEHNEPAAKSLELKLLDCLWDDEPDDSISLEEVNLGPAALAFIGKVEKLQRQSNQDFASEYEQEVFSGLSEIVGAKPNANLLHLGIGNMELSQAKELTWLIDNLESFKELRVDKLAFAYPLPIEQRPDYNEEQYQAKVDDYIKKYCPEIWFQAFSEDVNNFLDQQSILLLEDTKFLFQKLIDEAAIPQSTESLRSNQGEELRNLILKLGKEGLDEQKNEFQFDDLTNAGWGSMDSSQSKSLLNKLQTKCKQLNIDLINTQTDFALYAEAEALTILNLGLERKIRVCNEMRKTCTLDDSQGLSLDQVQSTMEDVYNTTSQRIEEMRDANHYTKRSLKTIKDNLVKDKKLLYVNLYNDASSMPSGTGYLSDKVADEGIDSINIALENSAAFDDKSLNLAPQVPANPVITAPVSALLETDDKTPKLVRFDGDSGNLNQIPNSLVTPRLNKGEVEMDAPYKDQFGARFDAVICI